MSIEQGRVLLSIARQSIKSSWSGSSVAPPKDAWLDEPGATFVTLMKTGELRGCVGSLLATRPLRIDVERNARAAAFEDSRFSPVCETEFGSIDIEVSRISSLEPISFANEGELLETLRPGIDGVLLEHGWNRGTFLPQVWQQLPEPRQFMDQLKLKAGLPAGFWSSGLKVSRYTVTKWREADTNR